MNATKPSSSAHRRAGLLAGVSVAAVMAGHAARAAAPLSQAWLAAREGGVGGVSHPGSATASGSVQPTGGAASSQSARQVQAALQNFQTAASTIAAAGNAQAAARTAALATPATSIPNGLGTGGLQPLAVANWTAASAPAQTASATAGRVQVTVRQTAQKAIAQWTTFNVGSATDLVFDQSAGGSSASSWVILNRVSDPAAQPSQVLGSIKAAGQVFILNRNGIVFGAGSQVDVGALLATTADFTGGDSGFLNQGIYSAADATGALLAAFGGTLSTRAAPDSAVTVQAGASLTTAAPASATSGGGFVILLAGQVSNAGAITTPSGQTAMAAGQSFILTPGYSATGGGDSLATTLGSQIAANSAGAVGNTGLITATQGDVTLAGQTVTQAGSILATSTTNQRGTIHLLTNISDPAASVTFAPHSVTQVAPDTSSTATALNSQRASLIAASAAANAQRLTTKPLLNDTAGLPDQLDQGRVEVTAGNLVNVQGGALVMAQGGQVAISAGASGGSGTQRIFIGAGATVDVSGLLNVPLPASANSVTVSIESNELRDSVANRSTGALNSSTVTVDQRNLQTVAATTAYPSTRTYTAGGLLEVSGEVSDIGHTVSEWAASGGSITLSAGQVLAQSGATLNLAGGSLAYAAGTVSTSYLQTSAGSIYNVNTAPSTLTYSGLFKGSVEDHPNWNVTDTFNSPLIGATSQAQAAYTVGRDAGALTVSAPTIVMDATVDAHVTAGTQQTVARPATVTDPFLLTQSTVPLAGGVALGDYNAAGLSGVFDTQVTLGGAARDAAGGLAADTVLPAALANTAALSATLLTGLGSVTVATSGSAAITGAFSLGDGGSLAIVAPVVSVAADVTARSGSIVVTNKLVTPGAANAVSTLLSGNAAPTGISVAAGVNLSTRGTWTNVMLDPADGSGAGFANGGAITLDGSGGLSLGAGSTLDVSAGGGVSLAGKVSVGKGGNVTLAGDDPALTAASAAAQDAPVKLAGSIMGYGGSGAGTLSVTAPSITITNRSLSGATVALPTAFFSTGFASYALNGFRGVTPAAGTRLSVTAPQLQASAGAAYVPSSADPSTALTQTLLPAYTFNPVTATATQRQGSSLSLESDQSGTGGGNVTLQTGSSVTVDAGQSVSVTAWGRITVLGGITAPSGSVTLTNERFQGATFLGPEFKPGLSIWVGSQARIDVSAVAATSTDLAGNPFGSVPSGGSIVLGGVGGLAGDGTTKTTDAQIIIRPGAVLDAAGTRAAINPAAGTPGAELANPGATRMAASAGGSISLSSYTGIFPESTLAAPAGGTGAAGGLLSITLETPIYAYTGKDNGPADTLRHVSDLFVSQQIDHALAGGLTPGAPIPEADFAHAYIAADQVTAGGFGAVALSARGLISFAGNVSLTLGQSISLSNGILTDTKPGSAVGLSAPVVTLRGDSDGALLVAAPAKDAASTGAFNTLVTQSWAPPTTTGDNTLSVSAGLIDIQDDVRLGTNTSISLLNGTQRKVDAPGFGQVSLSSTGDIRFLGASVSSAGAAESQKSSLYSGGDVTLTAAQVYPVTQARGVVVAGYDFDADGTRSKNPSADPLLASRTLTILQTPGTAPAAPDSVGGSLQLAAGTVIQDGTVRAPLGSITLGANTTPTALVGLSGSEPVYSHRVSLGAGSITSVSAAGQTIPFGGTSDTVSYTYDGAAVTPFAPTLSLSGQSIAVATGATVDLRGGGTLTGGGGELLATGTTGAVTLSSQGFISGRGGSTDTLVTPLAIAGSAATLATDPVYAVLPGAQPAAAAQTPLDTSAAYYGSVPKIGQTITLATAAGSLPAGTYTLLPSYYALLPGGYRVELSAALKTPAAAIALTGGTTEIAATTGLAGTAVQSALPVTALVTPGASVRTLSQYSEESYATFLTSQAGLYDRVRPTLPQDSGTLALSYPAMISSQPALSFGGTSLLAPGSGGQGATLDVTGENTAFEILAPGVTRSVRAIGLPADALDAIGASRVIIGGTLAYDTGISGTTKPSIQLTATAASVQVNSGATLSAPEVILLANGAGQSSGAITLRPGAAVDSAASPGQPPFDSTVTGVGYDTQRATALIVSNGQVTLAPVNTQLAQDTGPITIGRGASLLAAGSIVLSTEQTTTLNPAATLGAKDLTLTSTSINLGSQAALAAATLPAGLNLTQETLSRLLAGAAPGVPALQSLELTASQAVNLVGAVSLGQAGSSLATVTLATPALYGAGTGADVATINAARLVWSGVASQAGASGTYSSALPNGVLTNGPGSGTGTLNVQAGQIILGTADASATPQDIALDRTIQGFGTVNLTASSVFTANNRGTLSTSGSLTIAAPVITAATAAQFAISAAGSLTLNGTGGTPGSQAGLGATLAFSAPTIADAALIAVHGGKVTLTATTGDVTLSGATIDASGPAVTLGSQTPAVPGGTVILASTAGSVTLDAASVIDIASAAAGGSLSVSAPLGTASLAGTVSGAGATAGGSVTVNARALPDFAGLNARLDAGGITGARIFGIGTGDVAVNGTIRATDVEITASGGSLVVNGTIDASGSGPGTIRLAGQTALTLGSGALLDAHANTLAVDGAGNPVAAENRADIALTAATGTLSLAGGATLDVSVPGVTAYGTVELYAPRTASGIAIAAGAPLMIRGAQSVALYGMTTLTPAGGVVTQAVINAAGAQDTGFINAAMANPALLSSIAGLSAYGSAFHLRPGVELDAAGGMTVQEDLNLASLRTPGLGGGAATEPGSLTLRAGGTLNVFGSITDGFAAAPGAGNARDPDNNGWVLFSGTEALGQSITVPTAMTLGAGTSLATNTGGTLGYAVTLAHFVLQPSVVIPASVTLQGAARAPAGGFVATADIHAASGALLFAKGSLVPGKTSLPAGAVLAAGSVLPVTLSVASGTVWPAGASFAVINGTSVATASATVLAAGDVIPGGTNVKLDGATQIALRPASDGVQGSELVTAPLLPAGTQSWSIRLVAGADLQSPDLRATKAGAGDLVLADTHYAATQYSDPKTQQVSSANLSPGISVIRTGTGDLELLAGGSVTEGSLYGIYTAGSQSAPASAAFNLARGTDATGVVVPATGRFDYNSVGSAYQANYPAGGGNVLVSAQHDVTGDVITAGVFGNSVQYQSDAVGNWLWRQGGPGLSTAWWINYGAYAAATDGSGKLELVGFSGIGALGGGNVTVSAGADAGNMVSNLAATKRTTALDIAVASTGQVVNVTTLPDGTVTGGTTIVNGGGDVTLRVGGTLNGANTLLTASSLGSTEFGTVGTLRGKLVIAAGAIGQVSPSSTVLVDGPLVTNAVNALGGPLLLLGDAQASLATRGDLVLGGVVDATRTGQSNSTPFGSSKGGGQAAFTLWTGATSVSLLAAGGTLVPTLDVTGPLVGTDLQYDFPGTLKAVAAGGSIVYGGRLGSATTSGPSLELAPAADGTLELIAAESVNAAGLATRLPLGIDISGADAGPNDLPNPYRPSSLQTIVAADGSSVSVASATDKLDSAGYTALFAYEADTPTTNLHVADTRPALIVAAAGDIVNLRFGETWDFTSADGATTLTTWYLAAKPALIEAGRDIINAGSPSLLPSGSVIVPADPLKVTGNLILNDSASDASVVSAGRDVFYANFDIAGAGNLEVTAGRNLYQADRGSLFSDGLIVGNAAGSRSGGAGIILLAGAGASGPAAGAFAAQYLDPANLADTGSSLSSAANAGKVAQTYQTALLTYLAATYGFTGTAAQGLAYFEALPAAKQLPFLLTVYFDELRDSGREFTDSTSARYKSYARGRDAIATLFPATDYAGDITLYGGSGVATSAGGAIQALAPGGQLVLGLANVPPPAPASGQPAAGLITFGNGNIGVYTDGSVVLGQSRIFTTYGGGITIWSATGDILAGVGAKTTQVFQPAQTDYDSYGNITLAPTAPTSGAGIATLAPVAGVAAGDVDLIAPLGTIDAGEAGIRSSGNVNLAALVLTNTANVQATGKTTGTSVQAASNTGALEAASTSSAATSNAATDDTRRREAAQRTETPSVIIVELVSFGDN